MDKFRNLIDYIEWRGDLTFEQAPFNELDNMIFSMLSYIDFKDIVHDSSFGIQDSISMADAMKVLREMPENRHYLGVIITNKIIDMAYMIAETERYSNVRLCCFENTVSEKFNMQFAAVTFLLPDGTVFISFRGTDDTLVGWREDFYLMFESPVPSQIRATEYLEFIASTFGGGIRMGGHSKGGNLAIWAAVNCSSMTRNRLLCIYNNDGPGFGIDFYSTPEFSEIAKRFVKIIPDSSVVGLMLEENTNFNIVKSNEKKLYQHDPFSWEVKGCSFVRTEKISEYGKKRDNIFRKWLASMSPDERRLFTDTVFEVLASTNAKTLTDINSARMKSAAAAAHSMRTLDKDTRKKLFAFIRRFIAPPK